MEENVKREYICITESLLCFSETNNIINLLYFSTFKGKKIKVILRSNNDNIRKQMQRCDLVKYILK